MTKDVYVHSIKTIDRILPPTQARIDAMKNSLNERGQLAPILITKHEYGWRVVAGATRLAAAAELGLRIIKAIVVTGSDKELQLIEIKENLDRADWTDAERALLKAKRKELRAERLTAFETAMESTPPAPPAKGGRGKKGGVSDAARKAGVSKSTAHRHAAKPSQTENGTVSAKLLREMNEASRADLDVKFTDYIADNPKTNKGVRTKIASDLLTQVITHCLEVDPIKVAQAMRKKHTAESITKLVDLLDGLLTEIRRNPSAQEEHNDGTHNG